MFKPAVGEKMISSPENMKRDGDLFIEVPTVPYFSLLHRHDPLLGGSPGSRVCLQSAEHSPSSSSFSNGYCSPEAGSPSGLPLFEEPAKYPSSHNLNGLCLDSQSSHDSCNIRGTLVDELGFSHSLYRMSIKEDQNGGVTMKRFGMENNGFGSGYNDGCSGRVLDYNVGKHDSYGGLHNEGFCSGGFQSSVYGGARDLMGSFSAHSRCSSGTGWCSNPSDCLWDNRNEQERCWSSRGIQLQNPPGTSRLCLNDALVYSQKYEMDANGGSGVMDQFTSPHLMHSDLDSNAYSSLSVLKERTRAPMQNNRLSQSLMSMIGAENMEAFGCEESFVIQEKGLNPAYNKRHDLLRGYRKNSFHKISMQGQQGETSELGCALRGGTCENGDGLGSYGPLQVITDVSSLKSVPGYVYLMAQNQNGCRYLQKVFDEGSSGDIQIIFDEIIDRIVELMLKPFGNYVVQKLLDVCNDEQRLHILQMVTSESGQLVKICLNTYGTRVIQKLIETVKTRQQISRVILALRPGFLNLIKDQNGNHVIQRCLQCLRNEDNKLIFDAAAKFCVEVATHRHGCCVMQRCISHSVGKQRDKLIAEISKSGLLLAQDPFGNYVIQFIIELKSHSTIANLLSQFKGHYVHLSTQKFSSHVVEKCLKNFEESRSQIVREMLSFSHFGQLLQDPYANYVIQSALDVTKGNLHASLVAAVRPYMMLRTSPYCKRIFSRNLFKK